jgi:hypothetical protein
VFCDQIQNDLVELVDGAEGYAHESSFSWQLGRCATHTLQLSFRAGLAAKPVRVLPDKFQPVDKRCRTSTNFQMQLVLSVAVESHSAEHNGSGRTATVHRRTVRLCQTSWCDPAVRSHVGSLGGAVRLTVLALLALQLLAVCHTGDRIPDRSAWGFPTTNRLPWTPVGSEGARGLLSVPYRLPAVSIVPACSPDGSGRRRQILARRERISSDVRRSLRPTTGRSIPRK